MIKYVRKKPIIIRAVQWTGSNFVEIYEFTDSAFELFTPSDPEFHDGYTAQVYDKLHDAWIPLRTNDYVMEGIDGEKYPRQESVYLRTYEEVDVPTE